MIDLTKDPVQQSFSIKPSFSEVVHRAEQKGHTLRIANFAVIYPDGTSGALTLTKVTPEKWQPGDEIEEIKLIWK